MLRTVFRRLLLVLAGLVVLVMVAGLAAYGYMLQRESAARQALAPSDGRFVTAGDAEIFIQEAGPAGGRPVVLIPGTGAWSELYRETIVELSAAGYRVIALDMPPFGFSQRLKGPARYATEAQAARVVAVLDALKLSSVALVGHSVGARTTLEVALRAPNRVSELVLVDPALGLDVSGGHATIEQNNPSPLVRGVFAVPVIRDTLVGGFATNPWFTKRVFSSFVSRAEAVTESRTHILQRPLAIENTTPAYADWLHALMLSPHASLGSDVDNYRKLAMPVLIVWGREDTVTPLAQGEALKRLIPGSALAIIEGVGHIPYIEDNGAFNKVLRGFLDSRSPALGTR